jgi:hypothetical protein
MYRHGPCHWGDFLRGSIEAATAPILGEEEFAVGAADPGFVNRLVRESLYTEGCRTYPVRPRCYPQRDPHTPQSTPSQVSCGGDV